MSGGNTTEAQQPNRSRLTPHRRGDTQLQVPHRRRLTEPKRSESSIRRQLKNQAALPPVIRALQESGAPFQTAAKEGVSTLVLNTHTHTRALESDVCLRSEKRPRIKICASLRVRRGAAPAVPAPPSAEVIRCCPPAGAPCPPPRCPAGCGSGSAPRCCASCRRQVSCQAPCAPG